MEELEDKTKELNDRKGDIESNLMVQLRPGKAKSKEVNKWLKNVTKISKEVEEVAEKVRSLKFVARAEVSKLLVEKLKVVRKLYEEGIFPNGLVVDFDDPYKFPLLEIVGESTTSKVEEIWMYIMNDNVQKLGLYGVGGSGKTIVMQQVFKKLIKEEGKVDHVIWVTVSKALDVRSLQLEIAREIGLEISNEKQSDAIKYLNSALEQKGRYVLIFDDLQKAYPLHEIGIPKMTSTNKCKLVLTTRSVDVCAKMDCMAIEMVRFSIDDARELFLNTVGCDSILSSNLKDIAYKVVDECSCLPLVVVTIAGSMKGNTSLSSWKSTLKQLKKLRHSDIGTQVLKQLEFNYEHLKEERLKRCFLFCAFYPKDWMICRKNLVDGLINEGIIGTLDSIESEINEGNALLDELERVCLLESLGEGQFVKMHDLIRVMAIQKMNEKGRRCLMKSGENLPKVPGHDSWPKELKKASLMENSITKIPLNLAPRCPNLSTLMIRSNPLTSIADSFFTHLRGLTFLDLSFTKIEHLPNSVSNLVNLTVLLLHWCDRLFHVPSLANLTSLEKLDISYTGLQNTPQGSEMLTNLRSLDLTWTYMEDFPINSMSQLAVLKSGRVKRKAEEVACLKKLEILECEFFNSDDYIAYVRERFNKHLYRYHIGTGEEECSKFYVMEFINPMAFVDKYVLLDLSDCNQQGALVIPEDVQYLAISYDKKLTCLSDISSFDVVTNLKILSLVECDNLQCLFFLSSSSHHIVPATTMVTLVLHKLNNMHSLFVIDNKLPATSPSAIPLPLYNQLRHLAINNCPNIKEVFPYRALWTLQNLEIIKVSCCKSLEQIVAADDQEKTIADPTISSVGHVPQPSCLPNLKQLDLTELPELNSICPDGINIMNMFSIEKISIENCPKLKRIPISLPVDNNGDPIVPLSLKLLSIEPEEMWLSLEWDHPNMRNVLEKHFEICKEA